MDSCKVCGSLTASKHNHYGSDLICHSCRGFFMRSVKNSMFEKFKHNTLDGQCVIDSKTRQSCKKCRYEKCLQAGMRNAFVQKQAGMYELGFPTGRDSTTFRDNGTEVSSLFRDKGTTGQCQNLFTG